MECNFSEAGCSGATSLACVTITALTTLNRRYLYMEKTAAGKYFL